MRTWTRCAEVAAGLMMVVVAVAVLRWHLGATYTQRQQQQHSLLMDTHMQPHQPHLWHLPLPASHPPAHPRRCLTWLPCAPRWSCG